MRALSTPTIASTKIAAKTSDGATFDIIVEVGTPFPADGYWTCPVALFGLYADPFEGRGEDSLQALSLGTWLLGDLLKNFEKEGGSLEFKDGSAFPLAAYKLS